MERHITALLILMVLCAVLSFGVAEEKPDSGPRITFTVGSIKFTVPEGFTCTSNTEDDLSFENDDYAYLKVLMYNTDGYSFRDCMDHLDEFVYYDTITDRKISIINAVQMFKIKYIYNYSGLDIYGDYIGIFDKSASTLYILNYFTTRPFNDDDETNIYDLTHNIQFVRPRKTPEPTPTPTTEPISTQHPRKTPPPRQKNIWDGAPTPEPAPTNTPEPIFDYDAINRNPDQYKGQYFNITGRVYNIQEQPEADGQTPVFVWVATKGDRDGIIFMFYQRQKGEDRILKGDTITFQGCANGLYTYTSVSNQTITLPMFLGYYISYQ